MIALGIAAIALAALCGLLLREADRRGKRVASDLARLRSSNDVLYTKACLGMERVYDVGAHLQTTDKKAYAELVAKMNDAWSARSRGSSDTSGSGSSSGSGSNLPMIDELEELQEAHTGLLSRSSSAPSDSRRVRKDVLLLSDIDDSLFCTFKDRRGFRFNSNYPGAIAFVDELVDLDRNSVVFVTARPAFLLRRFTRRLLDKIGFKESLLLMGSISSSLCGESTMKANKKLQCSTIAELYPEKCVVFIGDNGQGDEELGVELFKENLVRKAFIHDIYDDEPKMSSSVESPAPPTAYVGKERVQTFVGAALAAYSSGLLSAEACCTIAVNTAKEFGAFGAFVSSRKKQRLKDFILRDVQRLCNAMGDDESSLRLLNSTHAELNA